MKPEEAIKTIRGAWSLMCQTNIRFDFVTDYKEAAEMAITALKEIQQYREVGTVEECQKAVEKQRPKAVMNRKLLKDFHGSPYCIQGDCPNCECKSIKATATDCCYVCGQHLKWNENLEGMEDENKTF